MGNNGPDCALATYCSSAPERGQEQQMSYKLTRGSCVGSIWTPSGGISNPKYLKYWVGMRSTC